jgi:MraZ protein
MDANGRIMLPVELRKQLSEMQMDSFVLKRAVFQNYLEMYPEDEWSKLMKKLNKLNRFVRKNIEFLTRFLAGVRNVNVDSTGRLQVPKDLVVVGELKKEIVIASHINILQIWDKDLYEVFLKETAVGFSELSEEVMGDIDFGEDE